MFLTPQISACSSFRKLPFVMPSELIPYLQFMFLRFKNSFSFVKSSSFYFHLLAPFQSHFIHCRPRVTLPLYTFTFTFTKSFILTFTFILKQPLPPRVYLYKILGPDVVWPTLEFCLHSFLLFLVVLLFLLSMVASLAVIVRRILSCRPFRLSLIPFEGFVVTRRVSWKFERCASRSWPAIDIFPLNGSFFTFFFAIDDSEMDNRTCARL